MLPAGSAPAWVYPQAKFDLDFANFRFWGGEMYYGPAYSNNSCPSICQPDAANSTQYAQDGKGILRSFAAYFNRVIPDFGLLVEDAATNYSLWSRDFTNASWSKTNITATKNQLGADLVANGASLLAATAANGTVLQTITLSSTNMLGSCYVKRVAGSGSVYITIDGSTYTDVTSQLVSTGYTRVTLPSQTLTNPVVGFKIAVSGDSIAVDFFQAEVGTAHQIVPSSPMPSTSTANFRYNEHISFYSTSAHPVAGQRFMSEIFFSGKPFSTLSTYSGNPVGGGALVLGTDGSSPMGLVKGGADAASAATYAFSTSPNNGYIGIGNWNKLATRTNGFGSVCCLNGGGISTLATGATSKVLAATLSTGAWSHGSFGNNGSGSPGFPLNGYIKRITMWDMEIADGQMIEYTRA